MKCKIFKSSNEDKIQNDINEFLLRNTEIEIKFLNQSQSESPFGSEQITVSIFYNE